MSCELEKPELTPPQRRQYHALIRFLAARLVQRNKARKEAEEHASREPLRVQATVGRPSEHPHHHEQDERPALSGSPAQTDELGGLTGERKRERVRRTRQPRRYAGTE